MMATEVIHVYINTNGIVEETILFDKCKYLILEAQRIKHNK